MKEDLILKAIYFEDIDYSSVYVHSSNLKGLISSQRNRPIYKITCNGKYVLRKIRAKAIEGLDVNSAIIDRLSLIELGATDGSQISCKKANFWERWVTYYRRNPNEDLRGAWFYFVIGQLLTILGIVISLFK